VFLGNVMIAFTSAFVIGLLTGTILHGFKTARDILDPLFATYYAIPIFAFYPLFIVMFGLGDGPQVLIGYMLGVVAVIVTILNGLDRVPRVLKKTARINRQVGADNRAADERAGDENVHYRSEQTQYQRQRSQYESQLQNSRAQQAEYENKNARYDSLRDRYADERAAYRRGTWPSRYASWNLERDVSLAGSRVELINGRRVGVVTDTSHGRNGRVTALLVRLDNNRSVWIDVTDVRYNRAARVVMTNLDRNDLRRMADQRL